MEIRISTPLNRVHVWREWPFNLVFKREEGMLMMCGTQNIHAPFTIERCLMRCFNYWDERHTCVVLEQIILQCQNPRKSNEVPPAELRDVLQALYLRAAAGLHDPIVQGKCKDALGQFTKPCKCKSRCKSKGCKCVRDGFFCSPLCHQEFYGADEAAHLCENELTY